MRVGSEKEIDVERWYKSIERDIAQKIIRQKHRHREIEEWIEKRKQNDRSPPRLRSRGEKWPASEAPSTLDARGKPHFFLISHMEMRIGNFCCISPVISMSRDEWVSREKCIMDYNRSK